MLLAGGVVRSGIGKPRYVLAGAFKMLQAALVSCTVP